MLTFLQISIQPAQPVNMIHCPICGDDFAQNVIEYHAAQCVGKPEKPANVPVQERARREQAATG